MADAVVGVVTETLLKKVASLAAEELSLAWGVEKQLGKLAEKLEMIQALLSDAHSKQLTSQAVQLWLKRLQSISLDAEIVLDDFGYEVLRQKIKNRKRDKVRSLFSSSSNPVVSRPTMAHKIKDIMSSLEEVYAESTQIGLRVVELINSLPDLKEKRLTDPFVEDSEIMGREDDSSKVISMLIGSDYERDLPVITILGMGGQGKTTLAQLVYKNDEVRSYFDRRVWVCVSNDFNVERLLAQILQSLTQTSCQLSTTEALVNGLKEHLRDKRYLLVLDDVWNENTDEWERMRRCLLEIGGSKGSKVMATTRSEEVASIMRTSGYHRLQILSEDQSWRLFEKCAFGEGGAAKTPELVDTGKRILKRCGGVPLAIKAIGGLLYSKHCELEWSMIEKSDMWSVFSGGDRVLSAIKLSYDHLPSLSLKKCFAYCAIFKEDTVMEKDTLIQLWMAQGLLNPPKASHLQMEDMGDIYFNILLRNSLLQKAQEGGQNNVMRCKMHDLVHDVSVQVSENYCFHMNDWKVAKSGIEAVHLSINSGERGMWKSLKGVLTSKLRTLHLEGYQVLGDSFANFRCLLVLIVQDWGAKELPNAIGMVKHLRLLDISGMWNITRLPMSLTELYYLQTLKVGNLDELPKGFGNLINLRHFYLKPRSFNWIPELPLLPGLSKLTNLQTLPFFKVDKCHGCQIEELESLDNLKGELQIFCLQNASSYDSAAKANLSKKSNIQTLELHWDKREDDCNDADVMEGLKPHSNLKSLKIDGYQSAKFPSWMVAKDDLMLLRNLVKFTLQNLDKCERLPSLGDLPCLKYLEIRSLRKVKCIGKEFYGWSNLDWVRKSSCSNGVEITLFPALRSLKLMFMNSLEEWSDAIIPTHSSVNVFPHLEDMEILGLPNLSVFPNLGCLPSLGRLEVRGCRSLTLSANWNSLRSPKKFEIDDERPALIHSSLNSEGPWSSEDLVNIPNIHYLQSLRKLSIADCDRLTAPFCSLKILTRLETLHFICNPSLWPKDLHHLIRLRWLELRGDSTELDYFPWPYSISSTIAAPEYVQYFVPLTFLSLYGWPKVTSLPDQIQYLTTLRDLHIWNFDGLEALPDWLGKLESLQELEVWCCKNLKHLPSAEAFQRLTNLQTLLIYKCPILKQSCTKGSGSEWPKIAHIPQLKLEDG